MKRVEVMRFHRSIEDQTPGDVGLSLADGKSLVNCVQREFVVEQIERGYASRRSCVDCGVQHHLHDSHRSELKTARGKVFYCRERWKACNFGTDGSRYVSPFKNYLTEASTGERRWLHAELGATMPYLQAKAVTDILIPTSGRDNHVTIRNHTVAIGKRYGPHSRRIGGARRKNRLRSLALTSAMSVARVAIAKVRPRKIARKPGSGHRRSRSSLLL